MRIHKAIRLEDKLRVNETRTTFQHPASIVQMALSGLDHDFLAFSNDEDVFDT